MIDNANIKNQNAKCRNLLRVQVFIFELHFDI